MPVEDYAFWKVPRAELEPCYHYECERERARSRRDEILKEAAEVENLDSSEDEKFRLKLELQEELDSLKERLRPWLQLDSAERQHHTERFRPKPRTPAPGVCLESDLSPRAQKSLIRGGGPRERLVIAVNWELPATSLTSSFARLVERLLTDEDSARRRGALNEKRGEGRPVDTRLYQLVVWRCWNANLTARRTMAILKSLKNGCGIAIPDEGTLDKKFAEIARAGRRAAFRGFPD